MYSTVVVVGGGPAGATAARVLADRGIDVVLVEKSPSYLKPCGGGVPSTAFSELDIPLSSISHRHVQKLRILSPSSREMFIELQGGSIVIVDRREFDMMLRELARNSGAEMIEGRLTGLKQERKRIVSEIVVNGEIKRVSSKYLIAADGVNSTVRRLMNLPPVDYVYTYSGRVDSLITDSCEFWFGSEHAPSFYSWVFPKPNGASVGTGTLNHTKAKELFSRFTRRRAGIQNPKELRGYKIPIWRGDIYNIGRVLFVGDAAGHVMPFTYEGIYYAMKSATLAAEALIKDRPGLYRKLWKRRFYTRFRFMNTLKGHFLGSDEGIEKLFDIFKDPKVQEASMRLWLRKDTSRGGLLSYISLFRKFLS